MKVAVNKNVYIALSAIFLVFLAVLMFRFTREDQIVFENNRTFDLNDLSEEESNQLRGDVGSQDDFSSISENNLKEREELKIGFVTDAHCYSNNSKKTAYSWELNWRCTEPLEAFIDQMNNQFQPDFVVDGGDLVDGRDDRGNWDYAEIMEKYYSRLQSPVYYVLGNHETRSFLKEEWYKLVGYEKGYYDFESKGYRIIVLDGNFKPNAQENEDTTPTNESYPGFIGPEQMTWLLNVLDLSKDQEKVVFVHQPPTATDAKSLEELFREGAKLRELFEQNNVRAVFSGHIERLCRQDASDDLSYFVLQGFWKGNGGLKEEFQFEEAGAYYEIVIKDDINVKMHHRKDRALPYEDLLITKENANCWDGSTLAE